jgi:uncharacterized membrane protein YgcG
MRLSSPSLRSLTLVALFAAAGVASTGCDFSGGNGGDGYTGPNTNPTQTTVAQVAIDADATLAAKGGDGVGVFVEYATGGHWHVFTACDYNLPTNQGMPCAFDVFAAALTSTHGAGAPGAGLSNAKGESLADKDEVSIQGDGTVHLFAETTTGLNGMTFDADPGVTVEVDVYLDNTEDAHFIYWIGDKVLHQGAPSDPLDLVPSEKATTGGTGGSGGASSSSSTGTGGSGGASSSSSTGTPGK